jgi:hypothetical protein
MTFTRVLAKGLALFLFSVAVLPTAWLCAAEEQRCTPQWKTSRCRERLREACP